MSGTRPNGQLDLLDWDPVPPEPAPEGPDLDARLRECLSETLARARAAKGMDRHDLAAAVSRLIGRDVSKSMLDRYCAPSAEEWRLPANVVPAVCQVTGDYRLLELLTAACGCGVLRGAEAMLAELGAAILAEKQTTKRRKELEAAVPADLLDALRQRAQERVREGRS